MPNPFIRLLAWLFLGFLLISVVFRGSDAEDRPLDQQPLLPLPQEENLQAGQSDSLAVLRPDREQM